MPRRSQMLSTLIVEQVSDMLSNGQLFGSLPDAAVESLQVTPLEITACNFGHGHMTATILWKTGNDEESNRRIELLLRQAAPHLRRHLDAAHVGPGRGAPKIVFARDRGSAQRYAMETFFASVDLGLEEHVECGTEIEIDSFVFLPDSPAGSRSEEVPPKKDNTVKLRTNLFGFDRGLVEENIRRACAARRRR